MVLLTGASGFIGRSVHSALVKQGVEVIALSRSNTELPTVKVDITDQEALDQLPWSKINRIVHLAAAGVKASNRVWADCVKTNIEGTLNLIAKAQEYGLPIIAGKTFYEDYTSENSALEESPYILTKRQSSHALRLLAQHHSASVTLVNIFQCYGPGDNEGNVLNYAVSSLRNGEEASFGPCKSVRDWIFIDDVVSLIVRLTEVSHPAGLTEYDAGTGSGVSIREVVELIAKRLNATSLLQFADGDQRGDQDITATANNFLKGWQPETLLSDGVDQLISNTNSI